MADRALSPLAILAKAVRDAADAEAVVEGGLRLSYGELGRAVSGFATQLRALESDGQRVAVMLGNSAAMVVACHAVAAAGATLVPLNPDYSASELEPILAKTRPAVIMTFACHAEDVHAAMEGAAASELLLLPDDGAAWLAAMVDAPGLVLPDPDAIALIQFTGGTTGMPKGVMLSHQAIAANIAQREAVLPTRWADERVLCVMPLFHSFASAMGLHLCANCAGSLHLLPRYRPEWVQDAIATQAITRLPAGPTLLRSLLGWEGFRPELFAGLRSVWSGSAPLPLDTLERWQAATGVPIYEGYGQTEAGPVLTYHGPGMVLKPRSVGPALPATSIRIEDVETRKALPPGVPGEIVAKGPQIMAGYLDDPATTSDTIVDGWLRTGDIGHLDEEGYLFITDRLKDMAIISGYNVYPREVDDALSSCPGVTLAATVAVPDAYRGEALWAFVEGTATDAELAAFCEARLARYKRPSAWLRPGVLPRTSVGKIDKVALRKMALERLGSVPAQDMRQG
jgi:long-chain acyl-CoA synthetase